MSSAFFVKKPENPDTTPDYISEDHEHGRHHTTTYFKDELDDALIDFLTATQEHEWAELIWSS